MSSFCSFPSQNDQTEKTIFGVKVSFPGKPYPSQLAMMEKILMSLKRSQSCLLESPTGSGKTLALLCASLAWQKAEFDGEAFASGSHLVATEVPNEPAEEEEEEEKVGDHVRIHARIKRTSYNRKDIKEAALLNTTNNVNRDDYDSDSDDFQVPKPRNAAAEDPTINSPNPAFRFQQSLDQKKAESLTNVSSPSVTPCSSHEDLAAPSSKPSSERPKVPKIFFGTRTHKQIAQVIRELRKTVYADIRMTVLASREHTCIHPTVSKHDNKNENCADLIKGRDGSHCQFYNYPSKSSKRRPQIALPNVAWDIEDIVTYGKKNKSCPYFMTRDLLDEAQIVFCPYNYLTDSAIRTSMQINLNNQVVILDEAHNIEDTARDAASFSLTALDLLVTIKDLEEFIKCSGLYREAGILKEAMERLSSWISKESATIKSRQGYGELNQIWRGVDMVAALSTMQLGPDKYKQLSSCMKLLKEFAERGEENDNIRLSAFASKLIEGLLLVLDFLFRDDLAHMDDYRVALVLARSFKQNYMGWKYNAALQGYDKAWTCTLNFWCLNPAVSFSDISKSVRCIVLTSGTLSPMKSFQSELGVNFPVKLEANHVIDPSQVWIGQISQGPMNNHLNGSFKYSETFVYQDEIGEIVHRVCSEVPYGVLCFFPSYSLLNKVTERWQTTGLYNRLEKLKVVLSEPRGSQKVEFNDILSNFYSAVEQPHQSDSDNEDNFVAVNGALLLAVCRGKVSEGLDFSDNNARAVITVGIPFPNYKDLQVSLKKAYNNDNCKKRDLLNGSEWYEIQAFRALNQALGRCIRHRKDWGVLLLVDSRIATSGSYQNSLSRWVRSKLKLYNSFGAAQNSLHDFIDGRKALEKCQSDTFCTTKMLSPVFLAYLVS